MPRRLLLVPRGAIAEPQKPDNIDACNGSNVPQDLEEQRAELSDVISKEVEVEAKERHALQDDPANGHAGEEQGASEHDVGRHSEREIPVGDEIMVPVNGVQEQHVRLPSEGASLAPSALGASSAKASESSAMSTVGQVEPSRRRALALLAPVQGVSQMPQTSTSGANPSEGNSEGDGDRCYKVTFTRDGHKKRCKYEDGVLLVRAGKAQLYNEEGKLLHIGKTLRINEQLPPGRELFWSISTKAEVNSEVPMSDFTSGRAFDDISVPTAAPRAVVAQKAKRSRALCGTSESFERPINSAITISRLPPGAIGLLEGAETIADAYLEARIVAKLRQHQIDGVRFMFRFINSGNGCILADSMGLGKSLQALCLVYAALNRPAERSLCRRAVIVCPASLTGNWEQECTKWHSILRLKPIVVQGGSSPAVVAEAIRRFRNMGRMLIISYEQLRHHIGIVQECIDLLICDEGHRLKSVNSSTTKCLASLPCRRRVLLTGTPLQNNLDEFWCCLGFVQQNLLPPMPTFQRIYKVPIDRMQDASASADEIALGKARSAELARIAGTVILRRGPEILQKMLPPRVELLLTVPLTPQQVISYRNMCAKAVSSDTLHLGFLSKLRQLCNLEPDDFLHLREGSEDFVHLAEDEEHESRMSVDSSASGIGSVQPVVESTLTGRTLSAKLLLLESLLVWFRDFAPLDGIVLVSGFIKSLDRCGLLCAKLGIPTLKLCGSTPSHTRMGLVSTFNDQTGCRVFLLSAKAGGVGLNLVGANRLVMLDPDWNPATDLQAMGRVWRQGQTKDVYIYRLATHGTIEEKILLRQGRKQDLASVALEAGGEAQEEAVDMAYLRKVYVLEGYSAFNAPLRSCGSEAEDNDSGGLTSDVAAAAGLVDGGAVRELLHDLRLLNSSVACDATSKNVPADQQHPDTTAPVKSRMSVSATVPQPAALAALAASNAEAGPPPVDAPTLSSMLPPAKRIRGEVSDRAAGATREAVTGGAAGAPGDASGSLRALVAAVRLPSSARAKTDMLEALDDIISRQFEFKFA